MRFYSTVDLVDALEREKAASKAGPIALSLRNVDLVIVDEFGYLPFSQVCSGGRLAVEREGMRPGRVFPLSVPRRKSDHAHGRTVPPDPQRAVPADWTETLEPRGTRP